MSSLPGSDDPGKVWAVVEEHRAVEVGSGGLEARRKAQQLRWMWDQVEEQLHALVRTHPGVAAILGQTTQDVESGRCSASAGARRILEAFGKDPS
jgi:LAO/AO transport system kinase